MGTIVKWGVLLGVLVEVWAFVFGFAGWYRQASTVSLFYCVVLIQLVVLILGLRQTAAQGRGYGAQIGAGVLMSLIGGVIIIAGSILFTTVVFPDYFTVTTALQEQALRTAGRTDAEIRQVMALAARGQTPIAQAIARFIGTLVTGVVVSAIVAAFLRAKTPRPASA